MLNPRQKKKNQHKREEAPILCEGGWLLVISHREINHDGIGAYKMIL
jgi:hypothetical protein